LWSIRNAFALKPGLKHTILEEDQICLNDLMLVSQAFSMQSQHRKESWVPEWFAFQMKQIRINHATHSCSSLLWLKTWCRDISWYGQSMQSQHNVSW
jgi:hypothetical protein